MTALILFNHNAFNGYFLYTFKDSLRFDQYSIDSFLIYSILNIQTLGDTHGLVTRKK